MFKFKNKYIIFIPLALCIVIIIIFFLITKKKYNYQSSLETKKYLGIEKFDEQYNTTGKIVFGLINPYNPNTTTIVTNKTVTFKTPFTNIPIVILSNDDLNSSNSDYYPTGLSTKNITINGFDWDISQNNNPSINTTIKWLAIEPSNTPL
jgi:hypothetical protein